MATASRSPGPAARAVAPILVFAFLLGLALATSPTHHAPVDVVLLVGVYLSLAVALHGCVIWLLRLWSPLGLVGSLGLGTVLTWHLREQLTVPQGPWAFVASCAAIGCVYFAAVFRDRFARPRPAALVALAASLVFALTTSLAFQASEGFRWVLLRHHKLLGTPAYYLIAEPVEKLRGELWEQRVNTTSAAIAASAVVPPTGPGPAPNIVFVLIDTLRRDVIQAYGGAADLMPAVSALARGSLVFQDVLANAAWTRPSMASFFTGLLPEEHGAVDRDYRLSRDFHTLAEVLRERGYETAGFVSNFAAAGRDAGFDQGFDHFGELTQEGVVYARAERVNEATLSWLRQRPLDGAPLFLYVHYLDPHPPYLSGGRASHRMPDLREAYDREVRYVDSAVGSLLREIDALLPGPSFLFLTSDHGEEFGEHGEGGHGHALYGEVIRLPAILRTPDGSTGAIPARLEERDFFDLFVRLAGDPGLDVAAWAEHRDRSVRYASIYSTTDFGPHRPYYEHVCMRGIEQDGHFLIWSAYGSTFELYDVARDPGQTRNLARSRPETVEALRRELDGHVARWTEREPIEHREDTEELLRRLGYVE